MTATESAWTLSLGDGAGTNGTLNLGNNTLTVTAGSLSIGQNGGVGSITEGTNGSFTTGDLAIYSGNTLNFGARDVTNTLELYNGSTVTTAAAGNFSYANVYSGSTLNLGAVCSISGISIQDGSTLNMNGNAVTAGSLLLGEFGSSAVNVKNQGTINVLAMDIGNGTAYQFLATDTVSQLYLQAGAVATTTNVGNVTAYVEVGGGSTLNLALTSP